VIDAAVRKVFDRQPQDGTQAEIRRGLRGLVVDQLLRLADDPNAMPQVSAVAAYKLHQLGQRAQTATLDPALQDAERACWFKIAADIHRFEDNRNLKLPPPLKIDSRDYPMGQH